MTQSMLSTKEAAAMLDVTESTVKRWADDGLIPCVRTAGGHRKFLLQDVKGFADEKGYRASGSVPPPMTRTQLEDLQTGVFTGNYLKIAGVLKQEALQADRHGLEMLLLYLYRQHIPFPVILDEVVRPGFEEIGNGWRQGSVDISQEHAASQSFHEALVRTTADLHHKHPNNLTVLCACPEGELHEIGLRGLAYSFEAEGWTVRYLGANTPAETLAAAVTAMRPALVCLSVTTFVHRTAFIRDLRKLSSAVHAAGGRLIVGGFAARQLKAQEAGCDHLAGSIQDAIAFARETFKLKPGPKSRTMPHA
jgi:MerR family transcriptional regulator, light-induced transcriptional regulator